MSSEQSFTCRKTLPCNLVHIYIVYCSILQKPEKTKEGSLEMRVDFLTTRIKAHKTLTKEYKIGLKFYRI